MGSNFTDCYNRVKLGSVVSEWQMVSRGCPQGSTFWTSYLEHLPKLMIGLIKSVDANMSRYADDPQFYANGSTLADLHDDLTVCDEVASSWYRANFLKGNLDKYQTNYGTS